MYSEVFCEFFQIYLFVHERYFIAFHYVFIAYFFLSNTSQLGHAKHPQRWAWTQSLYCLKATVMLTTKELLERKKFRKKRFLFLYCLETVYKTRTIEKDRYLGQKQTTELQLAGPLTNCSNHGIYFCELYFFSLNLSTAFRSILYIT